MRRRDLWLTGCALSAAALTVPALASAEPRTIQVTLFGGQVVTVVIDVPSGTPLDQVSLPPLKTPVVGVEEVRPGPTGPAGPSPERERKPSKAKRPKRRKAAHKPRAVAQVPPAQPTSRPRPRRRTAKPGERLDGTPLPSNPTFSAAIAGPLRLGVSSEAIRRFRIPPFLLPIYQAAGIENGVRWEVLAAINEIETDYGRNLNVSSAGAVGWMQFLPSTWKRFGVDANGDGRKDPYNPVDAIFSAARYLKAAGADTDLAKAVFAYNHADWYVESVLMRARVVAGMPADLVGSLTGLTQGRFPLAAAARYDDAGRTAKLFARGGAAAVAVQDGRIVKIGHSARLGRFVQLRDNYGNTYTYARLGSVAKRVRALPGQRPVVSDKNTGPETARRWRALPSDAALLATARRGQDALLQTARAGADRPGRSPLLQTAGAGADRSPLSHIARPGASRPGRSSVPQRARLHWRPLKVGTRVPGGTVLGRIGRGSQLHAPYLLFEVRPAGDGARRVDPKPLLDGWELLEQTAIYRKHGADPFAVADDKATIGQILLMSKAQLQRRVLADPRVDIYPCGRQDIAAGIIDRRVLATLEFLAASGMDPTVTALRCGHSRLTKGGNVSHHSSGNAADIARINGLPILGHQGPGSITDLAVRRLLTLQGTLAPTQIITLMQYADAPTTLALPDHADHIHVGFAPGAATAVRRRYDAVLGRRRWDDLISRLGRIENPIIPPSVETPGVVPTQAAE